MKKLFILFVFMVTFSLGALAQDTAIENNVPAITSEPVVPQITTENPVSLTPSQQTPVEAAPAVDVKAVDQKADQVKEGEVDENTYRFAENDPEKALDALLMIDNESKDLQDFILQRKWQKQARVEEFTKLFTPKLLNAWVSEDRRLAQQFCGAGFDASQGMCGVDYSPVTCEQESSDVYKYKTIEMDDKHAIVTYIWPHISIEGPIYRFIKDGEVWKLDGVKCTPNADSERDFNYTAK